MAIPICKSDNREDWLAHRRQGIGGSDGAAILGIHPWKTRMDVYLEKMGIEPAEEDPLKEERMAWGSWMEPQVRGFYENQTGRKVLEQGILYHHEDKPWIRVTPDGIIGREDGQGGILEIKATSSHALRKHWADGPPMWVKTQVYHGCYVMGATWGSIVVVSDGPPRWWDIELDGDFLDKVYLPELESFWNCVQTETPPDPDGSEACKKALASLYRNEGWEDTLEPVMLPNHFLSLDERRVQLTKSIKDYKREVELINQKIKAEMAKHGVGVLPDGTQYVWKKISKAEYTVKATTYDQLTRKAGRGD